MADKRNDQREKAETVTITKSQLTAIFKLYEAGKIMREYDILTAEEAAERFFEVIRKHQPK